MDMHLIDYPPPPAYDFPYKGPGVIITVKDTDLVCRGLGVQADEVHIIYGCSEYTAGGCIIVLPKISHIITKRNQAQVRRVENANCNGWPHFWHGKQRE